MDEELIDQRDYKRKLISKCSNERKSNRFWHSILLTGPDYKLLRPSVSELKQRAHDSFTKYVLPEDANGQNNPKPYAPQLMNTWEPTNAAETQYQDQPPDVTVTTRALGDDQLENIKNKLLSHSPKTRDELDIIELILAADNSIGKEKLLHLARRERLPDFEDLVNLEREVNGPVSEDREDVQHCCLGCEDGMLEEPVNWRGFGSGTAHENGGDNSQIAGSTTTAHQETTTQSKKPCFEKVEDSIIYEYQHKDVNSEALRHFCRGSKSLIDTDRTSNVTLTKSLDPNVKMVQAEKLGECSLLNHENIKPRDCDNSNTDWYFSEPVNWRGFGGNWTSSEDLINENQGCLDSKSSKQNSVNFEETCSPKIRGTTENLELTRCSSLSCDEVCEEPESFRGFGGSWSDPESATGGSSVRFHPRMVSLRTISDSSTVDESRNVFANLQPILSCGSDEAAVSAPRRPGVETKCPTNSLRLKAGLVTASANGPSQETQKSNPIEPEDFEAIEGEDPLASTDFPYEDLNVMMHSLMFRFQDMPHSKTNEVDSFIRFCASRMKADICARIERETQEQAENSLWFKLKFGRVTASNLYSVAQCRTPGGYLVKSIIGLRTWFCGNEATMRGKRLEREVADLVGKRMKTKFHRCGIFLSGAYPILGASPDAINDTFVVEIKSPFSGRSYADYLEDGYKIGKRYMAQVQLQMFMTGRKKGLFCVAAPDFETSRRVEVITVDYDRELVVGLIDRATKFWKANIFPLLAEIKREADRPPPDYRPL